MNDLNILQRLDAALEAVRTAQDDLRDAINAAEQAKEEEQPNLMGRWATHPLLGEVLICSDRPDQRGIVRVEHRVNGGEERSQMTTVPLAVLVLREQREHDPGLEERVRDVIEWLHHKADHVLGMGEGGSIEPELKAQYKGQYEAFEQARHTLIEALEGDVNIADRRAKSGGAPYIQANKKAQIT